MYNHLLKTFICVVDCGSLNKAAERLFLTPTAVMKQMNLLEKQLNLKLIQRTNRGIWRQNADSRYIGMQNL